MRIIVRDVAGKYTWDATHIYGLISVIQNRVPSPPPRQRVPSINLEAVTTFNSATSSSDDENNQNKLDFLSKVKTTRIISLFQSLPLDFRLICSIIFSLYSKQ